MGTVVLATIGTLGDLYPFLAVGQEMRRRGHRVRVAAGTGYRGEIERAGFEHHPLRPDFRAEISPETSRQVFGSPVAEKLLAEALMITLEASYHELVAATDGADLLVASQGVLAAPLASERCEVPWMHVRLAPSAFFSAWDPPRMSLAPWVHSLRGLRPWPGRLLRGAIWAGTAGWRRQFHALRRRQGLQRFTACPFTETAATAWSTMAWFSPLLGAWQPDWPQPSRVLGFAPYDHGEPSAKGHPDQVEQFLANGEPPVVWTLGSFATYAAGDFFPEAAEAAQRVGRRAVLVVGHSGYPCGQVGQVLAVQYAPFERLFPRAAAVVHQGGMGTCAQSLRAGVPQLVIPWGLDQPDNAERLVRLGVARRLPTQHYAASAMAGELSTLLQDPAYAARTREVAHTLTEEHGTERIADWMEEALAQTGKNRSACKTVASVR